MTKGGRGNVREMVDEDERWLLVDEDGLGRKVQRFLTTDLSIFLSSATTIYWLGMHALCTLCSAGACSASAVPR
jgi:hypothetical protein